jgi:hypothetical protein
LAEKVSEIWKNYPLLFKKEPQNVHFSERTSWAFGPEFSILTFDLGFYGKDREPYGKHTSLKPCLAQGVDNEFDIGLFFIRHCF